MTFFNYEINTKIALPTKTVIFMNRQEQSFYQDPRKNTEYEKFADETDSRNTSVPILAKNDGNDRVVTIGSQPLPFKASHLFRISVSLSLKQTIEPYNVIFGNYFFFTNR